MFSLRRRNSPFLPNAKLMKQPVEETNSHFLSIRFETGALETCCSQAHKLVSRPAERWTIPRQKGILAEALTFAEAASRSSTVTR